MTSVVKEIIPVAGLQVHIYTHDASTLRSLAASSGRPITVVFFLHGRLGSVNSYEHVVMQMLEKTYEGVAPGKLERDLVVIAFDQRNHGSRLVDTGANLLWKEPDGQENERHAIDMYSIQTGTARDVSFLIDFLPAYLFPSDERHITDWGVAGVSLGGHSSWIALSHEPRLSFGIVIIGCPDYLALISQRANKFHIPLQPPYFPNSLRSIIERDDPASLTVSFTQDRNNPFLNKKILVLSGSMDELVPWSASNPFVKALNVGDTGVKEVIVQENAGHEVTQEMISHMVRFVRRHVLNLPASGVYTASKL